MPIEAPEFSDGSEFQIKYAVQNNIGFRLSSFSKAYVIMVLSCSCYRPSVIVDSTPIHKLMCENHLASSYIQYTGLTNAV